MRKPVGRDSIPDMARTAREMRGRETAPTEGAKRCVPLNPAIWKKLLLEKSRPSNILHPKPEKC